MVSALRGHVGGPNDRASMLLFANGPPRVDYVPYMFRGVSISNVCLPANLILVRPFGNFSLHLLVGRVSPLNLVDVKGAIVCQEASVKHDSNPNSHVRSYEGQYLLHSRVAMPFPAGVRIFNLYLPIRVGAKARMIFFAINVFVCVLLRLVRGFLHPLIFNCRFRNLQFLSQDHGGAQVLPTFSLVCEGNVSERRYDDPGAWNYRHGRCSLRAGVEYG